MEESKGEYTTIQKPATGSYEEKGSRFLAFGYPVHTVEEAQLILNELKATYDDARHICYAYTTGIEDPVEKSDNGGEPAHTAGTPILGQLHAFNLNNCIVVVIRYFGGVKLGTGNLRNAYKTAAKNCLETAIKAIRTIAFPATITFPYQKTNPVLTVLNRSNTEITKKHFDLECTYELAVPQTEWGELKEALQAIPELKFFE